jgi:predicted 2-oxoglutarate/Fe(II)-dependent dioxygenase YbiX
VEKYQKKIIKKIKGKILMNKGELTFDRFGIEYKPKANQLIIFPSTFVYNHSVKEVISGKRYVVVSWAH